MKFYSTALLDSECMAMASDFRQYHIRTTTIGLQAEPFIIREGESRARSMHIGPCVVDPLTWLQAELGCGLQCELDSSTDITRISGNGEVRNL